MADNGGPLAGLKGYLDEIDHYDDELDTLRSEYMQQCKGPREAIKEIVTSAKEAEVNMPAFRVLLKEHRELRRHEKRLTELDLADKASYESMVVALGDFGATPLGDAALKKAKQQEDETHAQA